LIGSKVGSMREGELRSNASGGNAGHGWREGKHRPSQLSATWDVRSDCHVVDESIDVDELCRYTNVYEALVERFLA
jgi:hypothetical protein